MMISRGEIVDKKYITIEDNNGVKTPKLTPKQKGKQYSIVNLDDGREEVKQLDPKMTTQYKVRIPLIHGNANEVASVADGDLPWAVYYPLPGSQGTELNIGDKVLVTIVDLQFDDLVIIGVVNQKENVGVALQKVQYLELDKNAPLILSSNLQIGTDKDAITYKDLSWLKQKDTQIWKLKQGGLGVDLTLNTDSAKVKKKEAIEALGLFNVELISQSKFDEKTSLERNTIYYIWDDQG